MHATTTAAELAQILDWIATPNTPSTIRLRATHSTIQAVNLDTHNSYAWPATIHLPGGTHIPSTDLPALITWLDRLNTNPLVRIGTARLADQTGTLLTLRTGPNSIRLHTPANDL